MSFINRDSRGLSQVQFYATHKYCPHCRAEADLQIVKPGYLTEDGSYIDESNNAYCEDCGWQGKITELKASPNVATILTEDL